MANQYSFMPNIDHRVISATAVENSNRQDDIFQLMIVKSLDIQAILFTQGYQEGDEDEGPIVPPN